ncbi:PKD domain-containing protein, partial [Acidobacteriota bacterium]
FSEWKDISKSGCVFDQNSLTSDPKFISTDGFPSRESDFQLSDNSPGIDAGEDVGLLQDRLGIPIPLGFSPDIGAFEKLKTLYLKNDANPLSGDFPLTVLFAGYAMGDHPPFQFKWNFDDGSTSSEQNPVHTFNSPKNYEVLLSVTDSKNNMETLKKTIMVLSPTHVFSIQTTTDPPAIGEGGATLPSQGIYTIPRGTLYEVKAFANTNYRFSHWTGDLENQDPYKSDISVNVDKDISVTAHFFSQCGDVSGDLLITPADAQAAFDIYLGRGPTRTTAQKENADVNCDGTKTNPRITPADAQAIFDKYLGIAGLPCNCSRNSRSIAASNQKRIVPLTERIEYELKDINTEEIEYLKLTMNFEENGELDTFGFDLHFPAHIIEFSQIEQTNRSIEFNNMEVAELAPGILRIGGYNNDTPQKSESKNLINIIFKLRKRRSGKVIFFVSNMVDDLRAQKIRIHVQSYQQ